MERYLSGDLRAFSEVYEAVAPKLHQFVRYHSRDDNLAADIVQQTFLQMHLARFRFTPGESVLPWALAIARRIFIDYQRRRRVELIIDEPRWDGLAGVDGTVEGQLVSKELAEQLESALASLPAGQRAAYDLVERQGRSVTEAAATLGTSVGNVRIRVHRAYEALRAVWRGWNSGLARASTSGRAAPCSGKGRRP